jgi:hypothetical protein
MRRRWISLGATALLPAAAFGFFNSRPVSVSAVSPDGRYTAREVQTRGPFQLGLGTNRFLVIDNPTGAIMELHRQDAGGFLGDGYVPSAVVWRPDGTGFSFLEGMTEFGGQVLRRRAYRLEPVSGAVSDGGSEDWEGGELNRLAREGEPGLRREAALLLRKRLL